MPPLPLPHSIFQNQGKTKVLPVLPPWVPLGTFQSGLFSWLLNLRFPTIKMHTFEFLFGLAIVLVFFTTQFLMSRFVGSQLFLGLSRKSYCSIGIFYIAGFFYTLMEPISTYQSLPSFYYKTAVHLWSWPQLFGALTFDLWFQSFLAGVGKKWNVRCILLCQKTNLNQIRKADNRC